MKKRHASPPPTVTAVPPPGCYAQHSQLSNSGDDQIPCVRCTERGLTCAPPCSKHPGDTCRSCGASKFGCIRSSYGIDPFVSCFSDISSEGAWLTIVKNDQVAVCSGSPLPTPDSAKEDVVTQQVRNEVTKLIYFVDRALHKLGAFLDHYNYLDTSSTSVTINKTQR